MHAWLEAMGAFEQGVALFEEHTKPEERDHALVVVLSCGETPYSRRKLVAALQELSDRAIADQEQQDARIPDSNDGDDNAVVPEQVVRTLRTDGIKREQLTEELALVHDEIKRSYAEMGHLHGRLEILPTDKERLESIVRIDELDRFIVAAYARIDGYVSGGFDTGAKREPTRDELHQEMLNNRAYVCKKENQEKRPAEVAKRLARNVAIQDILKR